MSYPIPTERLHDITKWAAPEGEGFGMSLEQIKPDMLSMAAELIERRGAEATSWQEVCADGKLRWHDYQNWGHYYAMSLGSAESKLRESDEEHADCGPHYIEALGVIGRV